MERTVGTISNILYIALIVGVLIIGYAVYNFIFGNGEGSPCTSTNGTIWPFSGCNISAGLCCDGKCSKGPCEPTPLGGYCNIDMDCKGWSMFGDIACCNHKCEKKQWSGQICSARIQGSPCSEPSGTIWPFSGCDITAGMCCANKEGTGNYCSSTPCPPHGEGQSCTTEWPWNWWPWSGCDISAGLCCGASNGKPGKCSKGGSC